MKGSTGPGRRGKAALVAAACAAALTTTVAAEGPALAPQASPTAAEPAKRGEYIAKSFGCHDCHTPHRMGDSGPEPDWSRALSGHPQDLKMPAPPALASPWVSAAGETMTAWAGPWGVSFTANLTPDPETGLGSWTEQQFVDTIRSGRHLGRGRQILPPMPWAAIRNMTDDDLKAVFAYLRSIPPNKNKVPDPLPPPAR
jgi:mono/diheme cytochrome c family protein